MPPTRMNLKVLLPFRIFAEETGAADRRDLAVVRASAAHAAGTNEYVEQAITYCWVLKPMIDKRKKPLVVALLNLDPLFDMCISESAKLMVTSSPIRRTNPLGPCCHIPGV